MIVEPESSLPTSPPPSPFRQLISMSLATLSFLLPSFSVSFFLSLTENEFPLSLLRC